MFNFGQNPKVRGAGHLVLNVLRALNLIGLAGAMAASWLMIIESGVKLDIWTFDILAHLFVFSFCIFLFISELGFFKEYYESNWPVFGPNHSFFWLGFSMIAVGTQVLSNLDKPKYTVGGMGLAMFRGVYATGVLAIVFGGFNIIASWIFRDSSNGLTARHIRADGNLATAPTKNEFGGYSPNPESLSQSQSYSQPHDNEDSSWRRLTRAFNFTQGVNKSDIRGPLPGEHRSVSTKYDEESITGMEPPRRPPSALHPINRYSAAHMSQFTRGDY